MRRAMTARDRKELQIIRATEKLVATRGFYGTRMEDIARVAKLPRPNLYYYFPSKRAIYRRILTGLRADWIKAFEEIAADRDPREAIGDYVRVKIEYSRKHPVPSKIFAMEVIRGSDMLTEEENHQIRALTEENVRGHRALDQRGQAGFAGPSPLLLSALGRDAVLRRLRAPDQEYSRREAVDRRAIRNRRGHRDANRPQGVRARTLNGPMPVLAFDSEHSRAASLC